jgi:hypothetical protein
MLDWVGFGREYAPDEVRLSWDGERLRIHVKRRWGHLDIDFDSQDVNPEEAEAFAAAFRALQARQEGPTQGRSG